MWTKEIVYLAFLFDAAKTKEKITEQHHNGQFTLNDNDGILFALIPTPAPYQWHRIAHVLVVLLLFLCVCVLLSSFFFCCCSILILSAFIASLFLLSLSLTWWVWCWPFHQSVTPLTKYSFSEYSCNTSVEMCFCLVLIEVNFVRLYIFFFCKSIFYK